MQVFAAIATRKGLFELVRSGSGLDVGRCSFAGEPVTAVLHDHRDGTDYAALNLGHFGVKLHRRHDGSDRWEEIATPVYPPQPDERKDEHPWKLTMIWSLATGGDDEPGVLWVGTLPGGLFKSHDRGDSWELVRSLWDLPERKEWEGGGYDVPGIHSICVHPQDARQLLIGVPCGGAWQTRDGGQSWVSSATGMRANYMPPGQEGLENAQDPHLITRCRAVPEVMWTQHHCGIWRSTDSGRNWHPIGNGSNGPVSAFGFAVAAHPQDPDTAWFVPAIADEKRIPVDGALCVTLTRDGGKSFETLRNGLPQRHCYDLIYRHGLAVSVDGRTLLMGSTTGGVWISDNGGDDWSALPARLPPVSAVQLF